MSFLSLISAVWSEHRSSRGGVWEDVCRGQKWSDYHATGHSTENSFWSLLGDQLESQPLSCSPRRAAALCCLNRPLQGWHCCSGDGAGRRGGRLQGERISLPIPGDALRGSREVVGHMVPSSGHWQARGTLAACANNEWQDTCHSDKTLFTCRLNKTATGQHWLSSVKGL